MPKTEVTVRIADTREFTELMEAMQTFASNVDSFLGSLPFMAPESVGMHANVRLRQPLDAFMETVAELRSKPDADKRGSE